MSRAPMALVRMLALAGAIASAACAAGTDVKPVSDGPRPPDSQQQCASFCQHLRALGCPEGAPLPGGASCEKFCVDTQEAGHDLRIACVLGIQSCAELSRCR